MEKAKTSKKLIALILTFMILFSVSWTPIALAVDAILNSTYYEIDNEKNIIGRIEPETEVNVFIKIIHVQKK